MTAQRITLAEMTAVAHARGLEVELDNDAGLAYLWVGRREYVAAVPPVPARQGGAPATGATSHQAEATCSAAITTRWPGYGT